MSNKFVDPQAVADGRTFSQLDDQNLPTKAQVNEVVGAAIILQGDWNASTNTPDISGTTTAGYAWRVSVAGSTDLGGITDWQVGDLAVKTASSWLKIDNEDVAAVWGNVTGTLSNQTDLQSALDAKAAASHATQHQNGGADEISVAGLSGLLADNQNPTNHASNHTDGTDDIQSATNAQKGLATAAHITDIESNNAHRADTVNPHSTDLGNLGSGTLSELNALVTDLIATYGGVRDIGVGTLAQRPAAGTINRFFYTTDENNLYRDNGTTWDELQVAPDSHATSHQNGGADEISVAGLSGELADPQPPKTHATSHQNGGADEISVAGLSGVLADAQTPTTHAASHTDGSDDIQSATNAQKGLATAAHITDIESNNSHRTNTVNPHSTDLGNLGPGTIAELNALITNLIANYGGVRDIGVGTLAQRPAAGTANRFFYTTDEDNLYLDNGATWQNLQVEPDAHASSHQNGGADEIATATPAANAIPKADATGDLDAGWLPDATTTTKGAVELAENGQLAANVVVQGNDTRLSDSRDPNAHASSHQNGGADEIATATPAANAIPKAGAGGDLDPGWLPAATESAQGAVELATSAETAAGLAVQASDTRLSDSRDPNNHASNHTDGTDDIQSATNAQKGLATAAQITTLEDLENGIMPLVTETGTAKTLALSDAGSAVRMNNASANVLTIPTNASVAFPVGTRIPVRQVGAGTTSVTADTGVTLNGVSAGSGDLSGQWKEAYLHKVGTDAWEITGDVGTVA